jgi:hypothetical protein
MNKPTATSTVTDLIYAACRDAMGQENAVMLQALLPVAQNFDQRLREMEKSLAMLIEGQALVERHLAGAFGDDEPWRESLD